MTTDVHDHPHGRGCATPPSATTITSITSTTASCTTRRGRRIAPCAGDRRDQPCRRTFGHDCAEHDAEHEHGLDCGHEPVPHGEHIDYLVGGHLHHPHGDYCDDHGPVDVVQHA